MKVKFLKDVEHKHKEELSFVKGESYEVVEGDDKMLYIAGGQDANNHLWVRGFPKTQRGKVFEVL